MLSIVILTYSLLLISSASEGVCNTSSRGKSILKSGNPIPGRYIIKLKCSASLVTACDACGIITHQWTEWNGFAGNFSAETLERLLAGPDVEFIEQDGIFKLDSGIRGSVPKPSRNVNAYDAANKEVMDAEAGTNVNADKDKSGINGRNATGIEQRESKRSSRVIVTQTDAPWGLARLSRATRLPTQNPAGPVFTYRYDSQAGQGTDVYVLDTGTNVVTNVFKFCSLPEGIFTQHTDFGGRARWGATFGKYASVDGNGHGTHCAATAVGTKYGVAKLANVIAVKVLDDGGAGSLTDIISGINWIIETVKTSGRPSVILAPIGGSPSTALDSIVMSATTAGIKFVTVSGNSNTNSPARVESAITVGASTIADSVKSGSNFGRVIDMFAPGENVLSAWIGNVNATAVLSGSSAAAHVAGLCAYFHGGDVPCSMGVLTGVVNGTVNCLASNEEITRGVEQA